jgi:hypothetical protein
MKDDDRGEKVLVEVPLVNDSRPDTYRSMIRSEQEIFKVAQDAKRGELARGTEELVPIVLGVRGTRDLEIDHDIDVLTRYPHSLNTVENPPAEVPAIPAVKRVIHDKVILANLALELYRAIDETAVETPTVGIEHRSCEATINALRGALLEACLLVQRVVMMPATTNKAEVDERTRQLLKLIDDN